MYPLLFALLPGTIQAVYTQLLTKLKTSIADLQLFMNFETAAHYATRTVPSRVVSFITIKPYGGNPNALVYKSPTETTTFDNF
jgi:hypothetical protein